MGNIVEDKIIKEMKDIKNLSLMKMRAMKKYFLKTSKNFIRINTSTKSWRAFLMKRKRNNFSNSLKK